MATQFQMKHTLCTAPSSSLFRALGSSLMVEEDVECRERKIAEESMRELETALRQDADC